VQATASPVTPVLTGLNFPVSLKFAPDGRIFFTEKDTGSIRIILQNGTLLATPFATVSPIFADGEAGLLGLALDPSFASNGYVYVYYTDRDTQNYTHGHIQRYTATGNAGGDPVSIFNVTSSAPNTVYHNGGYIKFGPDGKLYYSSPDEIYSLNTQFPIPQPSSIPSLVLIAIATVGATVTATTAVYLLVRRRSRRSTTSEPIKKMSLTRPPFFLDG